MTDVARVIPVCHECGRSDSRLRYFASGPRSGMWVCSLCVALPPVDPASAMFGYKAEWADFIRRHPRFLARFPALQEQIQQVFARRFATNQPAERAIFVLGRQTAEDFSEVLLNVGNGYGVAGLKLLRPLFERVITMMQLIKHLSSSITTSIFAKP
jgi:hypothetical protein